MRAGCSILIVLVAGLSWASDGSFVSAGLELHYQTSGSGTPIVFLSGGPGLENYMMPAAEHFPSSYQRVLLDQRGTGRSRPAQMTAGNITLQLVVEDLEALRVHLKVERIFLAGHSWGGMLAMAYAAAYPEHVDRLILIDSDGPTMESREWFGDNIEVRLHTEDREARQYWRNAVARGVDRDDAFTEMARATVPGYFYDRAKALEFSSQIKRGFSHFDTATLLTADLNKNYDVRAGIQKLDRPVLIIHGHQDPLGDKTAEDIHRLIHTSQLKYIRKCGHFPWVEQPEEFHKIVNGFLSSRAE